MYANTTSIDALKILGFQDKARLQKLISVHCYYWPPSIKHSKSREDLPSLVPITDKFSYRRDLTPEIAIAVPAMVDLMLDSGQLSLKVERGFVKLGFCSQQAQATSPQGRANAFRDGMVARIAPRMTCVQRERLSFLFSCIRKSQQFHCMRNETLDIRGRQLARALGFVQSILVDSNGPQVKNLVVVGFGHYGDIEAYDIDSTRIGQLDFSDENSAPVLEVNLGQCRQALTRDLIPILLPRIKVNLPYSVVEFDWPGIEQWLGFNVAKSVRNAFKRVVNNRPGNRLEVAGSMLRRELDSTLVSEICRSLSSAKIEDYNWFAVDDDIKIRRIQAVKSYPLFSRSIISSIELTRRVDTGLPLASELALVSGLLPSVLKRTGKLYWQRTGAMIASVICETTYMSWCASKHSIKNSFLSTCMNKCPLERLPRNKVEWQGFENLIRVLNSLSTSPRIIQEGETFEKLMTNAIREQSKDWRLAKEIGKDIYDFMGDVTRKSKYALFPMDNDPLLQMAVCEVLVLNLNPNLSNISSRSEHWHNNAVELSQGMQEAWRAAQLVDTPRVVHDKWLPLDEDYESNGCRIEWLTTKTALEAETLVLGHCVWSYSTSCLYQGSHIGSIRDSQGNRSTVEIICQVDENNSWSLLVRQHRGFKNKDPSQESKLLVASFVCNRSASIDYETLNRSSLERCSTRPIGPDNYDWSNPDFCRSVIALYRPYMCSSVARLDFNQIKDMVATRRLQIHAEVNNRKIAQNNELLDVFSVKENEDVTF